MAESSQLVDSVDEPIFDFLQHGYKIHVRGGHSTRECSGS